MHEVTMSTRPRLAAHARLQWDSVREKQVVLAPEGILVLNATASAILALCDGQRNVSEIATELGVQYNRAVDQDVVTFLNRLTSKGLLQFDDEV